MIWPFNHHRISLRLKIILLFLLLVFVIMTTFGYISTVRELDIRKMEMKLRIERLANNIAAIRSVETEDWDIYQTYIDNQLVINPDLVYIAIIDDLGQLKVFSLNHEWIELEKDGPLSRMEQRNIVRWLDQRLIAPESQRDFESKSVNILVGERNRGSVSIGFSLVELNDQMRSNLRRNLILDAVFVVLAVLIAFFAGSRIVNPLGRLTRAMQAISRGDLAQSLHITSRDEIGEMATTFNYMVRGLQEKELLENFSRELAFTFALDKIAQLITSQISRALQLERGMLWLGRSEDHHSWLLLTTSPHETVMHPGLQMEREAAEYLAQRRDPLPLDHLQIPGSLRPQLEAVVPDRGTALVTPIFIKEECRGLFLASRLPEQPPLAADEIRLLATLLAQGSVAMENALLYEELTQQERFKRELEIARQVQLSLLPQHDPLFPGLQIAGLCIPAEEIGGDYYDYFQIDDHTIGIAIADVTGKGTSAAFYMAVIKGMMLSMAPLLTSPRELMRAVNHRVLGAVERKIFATMIYAVIDTRQRVLTFARAGHNSLLKRSADSGVVECLTPKGIGIGLADDLHFEQNILEQRISFVPGDLFILYTDGISEAMNQEHEEFGEPQLLDFIATLAEPNAAGINARILERVQEFMRHNLQHDDITLVTVRAL